MYKFVMNWGGMGRSRSVCVLPFPGIVIGGLVPSPPLTSGKVLDAAFPDFLLYVHSISVFPLSSL